MLKYLTLDQTYSIQMDNPGQDCMKACFADLHRKSGFYILKVIWSINTSIYHDKQLLHFSRCVCINHLIQVVRLAQNPPSPLDYFLHSSSPVGEGWKSLTVGHCLKVFSTIQGKTVARHFCNFSSEALQSQ